ncbi:hypothetical protein BDW22DRAFT_1428488 [Trametopsis cervina]|nr:hypothetical protein BDW22DRAFT_1428488 [Trametopsis cervina]
MAEPMWRGATQPSYALLRLFLRMRTVELVNPIFAIGQLAAHVFTLTTDADPINVDTLSIAWFGRVSTFIVRAAPAATWNVLVSDALDGLPARLAAHTLVFDTYGVLARIAACLHRAPTFGATGTLRVLRAALTAFSQATLEALHLNFTSSYVRGQNQTEPGAVDIDLHEMPRLRELSVEFQLVSGERCWAALHDIVHTFRPPLPDVISGVSPQFELLNAALAGVSTLEQCTLDLRNTLGAIDVVLEERGACCVSSCEP